MKKILSIFAAFLALTGAAAERPFASLLLFFSPESRVEFAGKVLPARKGGDRNVLLQLSRAYSPRAAEKGGEEIFEFGFKALSSGRLVGVSAENLRKDENLLLGFYPVALTELTLNGRPLIDGVRENDRAASLRVKIPVVKLEAGRTYRVRARIAVASARELRYGVEVKPAVEERGSALFANVELWSATPEAVEFLDSSPRFIKLSTGGNLVEEGLRQVMNGRAELPFAPEARISLRVRVKQNCNIRSKFRVTSKVPDARGRVREQSCTTTLVSLKCNGVELLKSPAVGEWYTWGTPDAVDLVRGKIYTFVFELRPQLTETAVAAVRPAFAADFSASPAPGVTLRPVFGVNETRSPLVTDATLAARAAGDRNAGYTLRRLSNLDLVFYGRRVGDPFRIFGVFEADADDPANYFFKATDDFLAAVKTSDIPIIYSLAPTAEYSKTHHRTGEPDRAQFVKVCTGIIRHYNEKWANGFAHGIKRWEIWNEPDSRDYWAKSVEEFGKFYAEVAVKLKRRFPDLEFGGPSFAEFDEKNFRTFLGACRDAKAPLDFFSFKCNGPNPAAFARQVRAAKRLLKEYGYPDTAVIISEYNHNPLDKTVWTRNRPEELRFLDEDPAGLSGSDAGAAAILAAILWQDTPLESACIYGFSRHIWLGAYKMRDFLGSERGGVRAVLPLYSEFFRRAAAESPVRVSAAAENLGVLGAVDRETGDGLLLLTALRDPRASLRLRLGGVADGTKIQVQLWPAPKRRMGIRASRPDHRSRADAVFVRKGEVILPKFNDSMVWLIRIPKAALNSATPAKAVSPDAKVAASVDFTEVVGKFKRLHGVNIAVPMEYEHDAARLADLGRIGFDTVRVHDMRGEDATGGMAGDTQNLFPNYHADPKDPANYNFGPTDAFLRMVRRSSPRTRFVFGLGPTIENAEPRPTKYWVVDPGEPDRFADLCIGIIRHYDKGWAGGADHGVSYYEIWNEPNIVDMWNGSFEDYCRFYVRVAKRIKASCPWVRIGGPALTGLRHQKLVERFIDICRRENAPLDFFSWHHYTNTPYLDAIIDPEPLVKLRKMLDERGFKHTELHLNEWRMTPGREFNSNNLVYRMKDVACGRNGTDAAASVVTILSRFQDTPLDMTNFYSYGNKAWGLYDVYGNRYLNWYAHKVYADFIRACGKNRVKAVYPKDDRLTVLGGIGADGKKYLLISAYGEPKRSIAIRVAGVPASGGVKVTVLDAVRKLETFGDCYENGVLKLEKDAGGTVFLVRFE